MQTRFCFSNGKDKRQNRKIWNVVIDYTEKYNLLRENDCDHERKSNA